MSAAAVLARLREIGVAAERRGDMVALRPASAMPPDLLARLNECKSELLEILDSEHVPKSAVWPKGIGGIGGIGQTDATSAHRTQAGALKSSIKSNSLARVRDDIERAERDAIEAEPTLPPRPSVTPTETMVEALAEAMANRPGVTVADAPKAMSYFRAEASRRLKLTNDPLVRGLLVGFARHGDVQPRRSLSPPCGVGVSYQISTQPTSTK